MSEPIRLVVYGEPAPQVSLQAFQSKGRAWVRQGGSVGARQKLGDWRLAIAAEARAWCDTHGTAPLDEPVMVRAEFILSKPASTPRWKFWVSKKPDLDRLLRSALDAITKVLIVDDSRVVHIMAWKRYAQDETPRLILEVFAKGDEERALYKDRGAA